jgi:hypothetical protein
VIAGAHKTASRYPELFTAKFDEQPLGQIAHPE